MLFHPHFIHVLLCGVFLPASEQQERAFTLGLAGLLGEGVYNFGELVSCCCTTSAALRSWFYPTDTILPVLQLMHPVLESLRSTDRQWLIDTLYAFNSGNVETFQALKSAWGQQVSGAVPVLQAWARAYRGTLDPYLKNSGHWCSFKHSTVMLLSPRYVVVGFGFPLCLVD